MAGIRNPNKQRPLPQDEDFKLLYPVAANAGVKPGVEWTIKGGIPYSVPQLLSEVGAMVAKAKGVK